MREEPNLNVIRMFDEANRYLVSFATELNSTPLSLTSKIFFNKICKAVSKELNRIFGMDTKEFIRTAVKVNDAGNCEISISFKDRKAVSDMKKALEELN